MHLVTFDNGHGPRAGVLRQPQNDVVDVAGLAAGLPSTVLGIVEQGEAALSRIRAALGGAKGVPAASVKILAPLTPKRNIFCVGRNYYEHIKEVHGSIPAPENIPQNVIIFTKAPSCVIGPGDTIPGFLDHTDTLDYEGELAAIIGTPGRGISKADALKHVFGYTIFNDVTARKLQRQHEQWFLGKSIDGFGPMGPAVVTADEIADVTKLRLQTSLNGEVRQNELTSSMIFDIPTIIETISRTMRLEPGDVIATGTPAGVGLGFKPPRFMKKGDVVSITIDKLGTLTNPVG